MRSKEKRERGFLEAGYRFRLTLLGEERYLKPVVASLWALVYLGGVGSRARRGGGNLDCIRVEPEIDWLSFSPDEKLGRWLSENLKKAIELVGGGKDFCAEYSNLSFSKLLISKSDFDSWIEALDKVGRHIMEFRKQHKNRLFEMGAFGLPIRHSKDQFLKSTKSQRRASPLVVKVIRQGDRYRWLMLRLSGRFLPEGESLDFGGKRGMADYKILEELRIHLRKQNIATSLKLSEPESLRKLTEGLIKAFDPQAIILFGSRARGDARRDSDIDIALEISGDRPIDTGSFVGNVDLVDLRRADPKIREAVNLEGVSIYEKQATKPV
ncbi:MAG: hypothetical protein D6804_05310 [Aquificota bacterium]|nr:MAG: hypothetical protein D6804_05310 [Aquificota bacterium]